MENIALKIGQAAPEFELMNQDKNKVKLSDYRGKRKVVLAVLSDGFQSGVHAGALHVWAGIGEDRQG